MLSYWSYSVARYLSLKKYYWTGFSLTTIQLQHTRQCSQCLRLNIYYCNSCFRAALHVAGCFLLFSVGTLRPLVNGSQDIHQTSTRLRLLSPSLVKTLSRLVGVLFGLKHQHRFENLLFLDVDPLLGSLGRKLLHMSPWYAHKAFQQ